MKFTEPNGAVRNEIVTYHLAKNRKNDGSWETVITPSPRAALFDDSSGNPNSQKQISQIRYT